VHNDIESDANIDDVFATINRRLNQIRKAQPLGGSLNEENKDLV